VSGLERKQTAKELAKGDRKNKQKIDKGKTYYLSPEVPTGEEASTDQESSVEETVQFAVENE
jgi:hypothetical protein